MPHKFKYFVWKAWHEGLLTRLALRRRTLINDLVCQLRHSAKANTLPARISCSFAGKEQFEFVSGSFASYGHGAI